MASDEETGGAHDGDAGPTVMKCKRGHRSIDRLITSNRNECR